METVAPEEVGFSSQRLQRLNKIMQGYVDGGKLAGMSVLLARDGKTFFSECFGFADRRLGRPMREDNMFRIYSMTKPIAGVAAMMLFEEGCFQLDDPVAKYIPELDHLQVRGPTLVDQERPTTIRQLFTHTAGFYGNGDEAYRNANLSDPDSTLGDMVDKLKRFPLSHQPGARFQYGLATDLVGRLVEVLSGQQFDVFLKERILDPLEMHDTGFYVSEDKLDRLAAMYGPRQGGGIEELDNPQVAHFKRPHTFFSGAGGLVSTMPDYLRFSQMLLNQGALNGVRLLAPRTVELMTENHLPDSVLPSYRSSARGEMGRSGGGYGLAIGVVMDEVELGTLTPKGASWWGGAASTFFWIDPENDLVAILMTQLMPSGTYPIRREFQVTTYQALME